MEKNFDKKIFGKTLRIVLACFIVYKVITLFLGKIEMDTTLFFFIREMVMLLCGLVAAFVLKKTCYLKPSLKYFGTGIVVGLWLLILPCLILVMMFSYITVTISAGGVILFIFAMIFVGIGEELFFRGCLLSGCMDAFGEESVSSIRKACIISGIIFGALHVFNVVTGAPLSSSIIQGICNIPTGILFGAIFIRAHKNIWPGIVLHSWMDFVSFVESGVLAGATINESLGDTDFRYVIMSLIVLAIDIFVLRKKKLEPLVKVSE